MEAKNFFTIISPMGEIEILENETFSVEEVSLDKISDNISEIKKYILKNLGKSFLRKNKIAE